MRCDACGVESPLEAMFVRQRKSFRRGVHSLCPRCAKAGEDTVAALILILPGILLVLAFLGWLTQTQNRYGGISAHRQFDGEWPVACWVALICLFQALCVVPHELAHAAAGWLLGFDVWCISLGCGRLIARRQIRGVIVEIRAIPASGFVAIGNEDVEGHRWGKIISVSAGPMANLLIALAAVTMAYHTRFSAQFWLWSALAVANILILVEGSLWPRKFTHSRGATQSDGRQLLELLFRRQPSTEARRLAYLHAKAYSLLMRQRYADAMELCFQSRLAFPGDYNFRAIFALSQLARRNYFAARQGLLELLREQPQKNALFARLASAMAWADLMIGYPQLVEEAKILTTEAYALTPWIPSIQGTRGLLLLETGEIDAGIALLKNAMKNAKNREDKATVLCALSIAHTSRGELAAARSLVGKASQLCPGYELLSRACSFVESGVFNRPKPPDNSPALEYYVAKGYFPHGEVTIPFLSPSAS